ncbi:hypothetical protein WS88_05570 [Burkholderia cepacia]|nr:hypothetical protein WS88_05570 [Burkholderia cepacia]
MSIDWQFSRQTRTGMSPAIRDQVVSTGRDVLCLRNPWVAGSVFMGKIYVSWISILFLTNASVFWRSANIGGWLFWMDFIFPLFLAVLAWYRIFFIKRLSDFYFNRKTCKVYYQRNKTLITFDWANTEGGVFVRTEFGGRSFSTTYALAFGPKPASSEERDRTVLWVDSNAPNDPDPSYIAQVWEYICQFMEKGPDQLPSPGEPNWWYVPLHRICLTPSEAWRHYAPWRTGEPGERQGKKNWLLPMWLILFPYNLFSALCWYVVCRLFNVRSAPSPAEALKG